MSVVEELEKELKEAKKKQLYEKWEKYLTTLKQALDKLKDKTICAWIANGRFALFQVKDIQEKYYADREGWDGQWSPKRWLEITTNGYILCQVADDKGRWFDPKLEAYNNHRTFKFQVYNKRDNTLELSKVTFLADNYTSGELDSIRKIGFTEYKEYSEDPQYGRALDWLTLFTHVVPNDVWDAAFEIHKQNVAQTKNFWENFSTTISKAPRVYDEIKI